MPDAVASTQGRVAVVTGGAGAIGGAIVRALENSGHRAVVIDRTGPIFCDLSSESSTRDAAAAVLEQYGRCDVFVQCAATFDLFPHMGCHNGIYFAAGYCFVGIPMGTYLGTKIGHAVLGNPEARSVFADKSFRSLPFYRGRPWFIPLVTRYWQSIDSRAPSGILAA